jgi:hypothetical protein
MLTTISETRAKQVCKVTLMFRLIRRNVCLVLAVLALIAFVVWCCSVSPDQRFDDAHVPAPPLSALVERYELVEDGMSTQQVRAILGQPESRRWLFDTLYMKWSDGQFVCLVAFFCDGTVFFKRLHETDGEGNLGDVVATSLQ